MKYLVILLLLAGTCIALPEWIDEIQYEGYELAGYEENMILGVPYCGEIVVNPEIADDPDFIITYTFDQIPPGFTVDGGKMDYRPTEKGVFYILVTISVTYDHEFLVLEPELLKLAFAVQVNQHIIFSATWGFEVCLGGGE